MVVREKLGNNRLNNYYLHTSATPLPVEDGCRILVMVDEYVGYRELKKLHNEKDDWLLELPKKLVKDVL